MKHNYSENYENCVKNGNFEEFGGKKQEQFEQMEFLKFDDAVLKENDWSKMKCNEGECAISVMKFYILQRNKWRH